jgi:long-subunit fatty acid transport protein
MLMIAAGTRCSLAQLLPVLGAQKAGTASAEFLKIGVGARAAGMGEAFAAMANDASALYWNPAGLVQFQDNEVIAAHTNWLVDIKHDFIGGVYHLSTEDAVGLSITSLQTDDMPVTTELQPYGNGTYFHYGDVAVGLTYSRRMTPQFSFGGTVRYLQETLDVLTMRGVVVDLGTYYWTGLGTSRFSVVLTNFGNEMAPTGTVTAIDGSKINQFQQFSPPTIFKFGFAFDPYRDEDNSITTSIQLNHPNDNSENFSIGAEYQLLKTFFLRGGYKFNVDEESYTFGAGVATSVSSVHMNVDYGYSAFGRLGGVHRLSVLLGL